MTLLELATRAEQAGVDEQRHILELAWQEVYGHFPGSHESLPARTLLFARRLNAEAYLDAALMLVPEGWFLWQLGEYTDNSPFIWHSTLWHRDADLPESSFTATTPALALTAAALGSPNFKKIGQVPVRPGQIADVVEDDSAAEPVVELVPAEGFETSAEETPPMPQDAEGYELALLRFFRDLYENERLKILVELDAIPAESNERINQGLERRLFDWLAREGRLPDLILMIDRLITAATLRARAKEGV